MDLQAVNAIYILIWQSECALTFKMPDYHKSDACSHLQVVFYAFRVFSSCCWRYTSQEQCPFVSS